MKKLLLLGIFLGALGTNPFLGGGFYLVCDPSPVTVNYVEIRYTENNIVITETGSYAQQGNVIILYDFPESISGKSNFQARWSKDGSYWTDWVTAPMNSGAFWF